MAERLSDWSQAPAGIARYPWGEWEDGGIWKINRGEDFTIAVRSMSSVLYMRARKMGCRVKVRQSVKEGWLIFQFLGKAVPST